jgi:carbonic anhydrase
LDSIEDETERFNAFVEINAKEQVYDLSKTSIDTGSMEKTDKI